MEIESLFEAISKGKLGEVRSYIENHDVVNVINIDGYSPLFYAIKNNREDIAQLLVEHGADVNYSDYEDQSCLIYVVQWSSDFFVTLLLKANADPNKQDIFGRTALMYASAQRKEKNMILLLRAKADVTICDVSGKTALDYAVMTKDNNIKKILISNGAKKGSSPPNKIQSLYLEINKLANSDAFDDYKNISKLTNDLIALNGFSVTALLNISIQSLFFKDLTYFGEESIDIFEITSGLFFIVLLFAFTLVFLTASSSIVRLLAGPIFLSIFIPHLVMLLITAFTFSINLTLVRGISTFVFSTCFFIMFTYWIIHKKPALIRRIFLHIDRFNSSSGQQFKDNLMVERHTKNMSAQSYDYISVLMHLASARLRSMLKTHTELRSIETKRKIKILHSCSLIYALFLLIYFAACFIYLPLTLPHSTYILDRRLLISNSLMLVIFYSIYALFWAIEKKDRSTILNLVQKDLNLVASKIAKYSELQEVDQTSFQKSYGLYLRTFASSGKLNINGIDIETNLAYSLPSYLPIIACGNPENHFSLGAGKVHLIGKWQNKIKSIIDNAQLIFIIPSHSEGVIWELQYLKENNHLSKTFFLMLPNISYNEKPFSEEWNETVGKLKEYGFSLPKHFHKGLIFSLNSQGHMINHAPFGLKQFIVDYAVQYNRYDRDNEIHNERNEFNIEADAPIAINVLETETDGGDDGWDGDDWDYDGGWD